MKLSAQCLWFSLAAMACGGGVSGCSSDDPSTGSPGAGSAGKGGNPTAGAGGEGAGASGPGGAGHDGADDASVTDGANASDAAFDFDSTVPMGNGYEPSAACVAKVNELLGKMSPDQKVAQLLLYSREAATPANVTTYGLGGILSAGGSGPADNSAKGWADEVDVYRAAALKHPNKIPLIFGIDAVHGNGGLKGATVFPHNIGLGAGKNPATAEKVGQITALEVAGVGMDFVFGPMIAVARDDRWGREDESYGETTELARLLGPAVIRGLQGPTLGGSATPVVACAKHFAGDGGAKFGSAKATSSGNGVNGGTDRGDATGDEAELLALHVKPYESAVAAGVGAIMATVSRWKGIPGHANKHLITDVLKGEMKYNGLVTSDYDGIDQSMDGASPAENYAAALNAGIDMIMTSGDKDEGTPGSTTAVMSLIKGLVPSKVPQARLDDAVSRILNVKCAMKLFESDGKVDRTLTAAVGSTEHRAVAREAVRQSMVVLKNEGAVLPLAKTVARVHLGGKNADNIGNQCGGWTIEWQGKSGAITTGTTIRKGIEAVVGAAKVTYALDGKNGTGADVGIAVIGETPYAEWYGDKSDLKVDAADVAAVKAMKDAGLKVVVVLVSGRPLLLDAVSPLADAIVAAWLPGTEGAGVADVLFGDYQPTGKLPQSWPRTMSQIPINSGDATYDPLFAYGFGLSYP